MLSQFYWTCRIGIRIKECRNDGSGSSEDGNTFRRAFKTHKARKILSEECDVPIDFIYGLWVVYVALTSTQIFIDPKLFGAYCKKVLDIYFTPQLNWYRMIPSVHKILVHGEELLQVLEREAPTLTPGQLSEEPSEHFNKLLKNDEIGHAPQNDRKMRLKAMSDRGIERSDVIVRSYEASQLGHLRKKAEESDYPPEVWNMRRKVNFYTDMSQIAEILE